MSTSTTYIIQIIVTIIYTHTNKEYQSVYLQEAKMNLMAICTPTGMSISNMQTMPSITRSCTKSYCCHWWEAHFVHECSSYHGA